MRVLNKILITGATGLVGKSIISQCHKENIEVNFLTSDKDKVHTLKGCKGYFVDTTLKQIDSKALVGVDTIINLAGANIGKRWTKKYKTIISESRISILDIIIDHLSQNNQSHQIKQIISSSGINIYRHSYREIYSEESKDYDQGFLSQVVQKWEKKIIEFEKLGIKTTILRMGIVLDKNKGALPKMISPIKNNIGSVLGNGKQKIAWIHKRDLSNMFLFVAKNRLSGIFNSCSSDTLTNKEFTHILANHLGKKIYLPNIPIWLLRAMLGQMSDLLLQSVSPSNQKIRDKGFVFEYNTLARL